MLTFVLICGFLTGQTDTADAAEDSAALKRQVLRLVRSLNSDDSETRSEAEKALADLGPQILDHLPKITPDTPAEVKQRLDGIRRVLEKAAAESAGKASLVTLQGKMKLSEALQAIQQQTANKIVDMRQQFGQQVSDPDVELDFEKVPCWQALDQLLDDTGLTVYGFGGNNELAIVSAPENSIPRVNNASYNGPFRMETLRVESSRDLRNPTDSTMFMTVEFAWEPRSTPIAMELSLADLKAEDEAGNAVNLAGRQQRFEVPIQPNSTSTEMRIPFALPDRSIKQIAKLSGELTALVPGRKVSFEFSGLKQARSVEQEKGGVTVVLEQTRKNADLYELRTRLRFVKAANALDSHRDWIYRNKAVLVDAQGKVHENVGLDAARTAENEAALSYLFDVPGGLDGMKFVYESPALILKLPVQFELKNIDLP